MKGTPKLTKATFEMIARVLKQNQPITNEAQYAEKHQWALIVEDFATALRRCNPLFDTERFVRACNVETSN